MNSGRALFLLVFCLAFVGVQALTVELDKQTYFKGQEMAVSGQCTANETVEVSAWTEKGKAKPFAQAVPCNAEGKYSLFQGISFLVPSGQWTVKAVEGQASAEAETEVKPTADSDYYLVTFVSPAPVKHYKTESLSISVKLSESGEPVSGANVVFFDVSGEPRPLEETGLGVYSADYLVPFDAQGGNWFLHVLAEKTGEKSLGGANTLVVGIDRADLKLEVLEPSISNFDLETEIPFKVKASYPSGKPLTGGKAWLEFNGSKVELQPVSGVESTFAGKFEAEEKHIGSLSFALTVADSAGNEGKKVIDLVITVDRTALFLKNNGLIIVFALVLLGAAAYTGYSKVRGQLDRKSLLAERGRLREGIRKIQADYFDRMVIDKNTFKKRLGEAEARLIEIDKILKSQGGEEGAL